MNEQVHMESAKQLPQDNRLSPLHFLNMPGSGETQVSLQDAQLYVVKSTEFEAGSAAC